MSPCPRRPPSLLARIYLVRATDALASATAMYAVPLLVLTTTGSSALTGLAFALEWIPRLVAITVGGPLVDRLRPHRVFATANTVRTVVVLVTAAVLAALPGTGPAATAAILAFGAVSGMLAQLSFLGAETVGAQAAHTIGTGAHRIQAAQIGIDQGALLLGPLLAGLLLLPNGPTALLTAIAVLSVTAAAANPPHTPGSPGGDDRKRGLVLGDLRTGWRFVAGTPALAWLVAALVAANLALGVLQVSAPITITGQFGRTPAAVGAVWSIAALASLAAITAARHAIDRWGLYPVGAVSAATACAAAVGAALAPTFSLYTAAVAVLLAGDGAMTVVLRTLRARLIPARVFGSALAATVVLVLLPFPLAGALVAVLPSGALPGLLLGCAVLQAVVMTACFRGLWHHRASYTARTTVVMASAARPTEPTHPA